MVSRESTDRIVGEIQKMKLGSTQSGPAAKQAKALRLAKLLTGCCVI